MKKAIALLLAVMLVVSMAPAAFASTTTLTTTVPGAAYEFSIPADTTIEYNALDTSIGYLEVTESAGLLWVRICRLPLNMVLSPTLTVAPLSRIISMQMIPQNWMIQQL